MIFRRRRRPERLTEHEHAWLHHVAQLKEQARVAESLLSRHLFDRYGENVTAHHDGRLTYGDDVREGV